MWFNARLLAKIFTLTMVYLMLVFLRKTILSVDLKILSWLVRQIKFPDYEGHSKGFLNLGEVTYNITQIKLDRITADYSEINVSSLPSLTQAGPRYLNISLCNVNTSFRADWAYSVWPSVKDQGKLSVGINNAFLTLAVKIYTDARGLINFTVIDCAVRVAGVDIQLKNAPNLIYESLTSAWQTRAEQSLPGGLCKALRYGVTNQTNSIVRTGQLRIVSFILSGEALRYQTITGWIFLYFFPASVKLIHDFGVTLLVLFAVVSVYVVYELTRFAQLIAMLRAGFHKRKGKLRRTNDGAEESTGNTTNFGLTTTITLTDVVELVSAPQNESRFVSRLKKILWWKKTKKN